MYAKLFSRITESSLLEESVMTRWVFVALLAIAELDGTVIGTDIAIARRINVPLKDFEDSMKILMAPDPHSNNQDFAGARVILSTGERGYFLTGYARYRGLKTEDERREYMKQYMATRRGGKQSVNSVNIPLAQLTHAESESNSQTDSCMAMEEESFNVFWKAYPRKQKKLEALAVWKILKPSVELRDLMLKVIAAQKTQDGWTKENGKWIPNPSKWLQDERWTDEIKIQSKQEVKTWGAFAE